MPDTPKITQLIDYELFCGLKSVNEITFEAFQTLNDYQLIDVRELHEYEAKNIGGELMPLSEIDKYLPKISRDKTVVIHCQSGIRSQKAIKILQENFGFTNLVNLIGGINKILDNTM
jgi:adenylyltransferase/sulfurtransferase